ncbi:MAG: protein kinase [Byssovorax sp.]
MSAEPISAGLRLGRYELLVPIAKGGMASVWAARLKGPRGFEKIVAVKIMLTDLGDDFDAQTMFLDEARLVAQIRHANVAEVVDFGEEGEALYMIMEWVDGEPLHVIVREAMQHGGFPVAVVGQIARQVCAGLHAAHDLRDASGKTIGLVHRDVSPQNILVGYDGVVKIIDFGVAKAESNQLRTNVGQIKGKVGYMAPEQAFGEPVDRRTDIFALGIVLYLMLSGRNPFRGETEYATLGRIRDKRPADPLRTLVPAVPEAVEQVVMKALAKNRADRFSDMMELARAIEAAFPPLDGGAEALAAYMRSILGMRGETKRRAIREATQRADLDQPPPSAVPSAFALASNPSLDEAPTRVQVKDGDPLAAAPTRVVPKDTDPLATAPTRVMPRNAGLAEAPLGDPAAEIDVPILDDEASPPVAAPFPSADLSAGMPDFRPRRLGLKVIAAALAIVLAIGLALWGASEDGPSPPDPGTPAGKKPW